MTTPHERAGELIVNGSLPELAGHLKQHPDLLSEMGEFLLEDSIKANHPEMVTFFIDTGIELNPDTASNTPLQHAAEANAVAAAEILLDRGALIGWRGKPNRGATPLHKAARAGHLEMVKLLMERGADPLALYGYPRKNAMAFAKEEGHAAVVAYFERLNIPEISQVDEPVDVETAAFKTVGEIGPVKFYEQKWQDVYDYGCKHGLASMCEKNQVLFLVGYLINQLCNGGATFLYFNPSGEYVAQMPAGLDKIGAKRAAAVVRQINALFPASAPAKDMTEREQQMIDISDQASPLGAELEAIFGEWVPKGERVLLVQLYDYYRKA